MSTDMEKIAAQADFKTECHRRIAAIHDADSYSLVHLWVTGAPEYSDVPEWVVDELLHHLEWKRQEIVRKAFVGSMAG